MDKESPGTPADHPPLTSPRSGRLVPVGDPDRAQAEYVYHQRHPKTRLSSDDRIVVIDVVPGHTRR